MRRIQNGQSILDGVRDQARSLAATLGAADRQRLDLLLTSIREAEQRLQQDEDWVQTRSRRSTSPPPTRTSAARSCSSAPGNGIDSSTSPCRPTRRGSSRCSSGSQDAARDRRRHARPSRRLAPRPGPSKIEQLALIEEAEIKRARRVPREDEEHDGRRATRCSIARWSSTPATWATPRRTTSTTCRSCSPAAASSTRARRLRPQEQHAALEPVRAHAAPDGHRGGAFGASTGVLSEV